MGAVRRPQVRLCPRQAIAHTGPLCPRCRLFKAALMAIARCQCPPEFNVTAVVRGVAGQQRAHGEACEH